MNPSNNRSVCYDHVHIHAHVYVYIHVYVYDYDYDYIHVHVMIMYMNIYISPRLEKRLRQEKSMAGLINKLLDAHYNSKKDVHVHEHEHAHNIPKISSASVKPAATNVDIPPSVEEPAADTKTYSARDAEDYTSRLIPDEGNKHRAYDPEFEEYVRVKWVKGKMVRVEETA